MVGEEVRLAWRPSGALLLLECITEGKDQEWKEEEDAGDAEDSNYKRHGSVV